MAQGENFVLSGTVAGVHDPAAVPQCCAEGLALPTDLETDPAATPPVRGRAPVEFKKREGKAEPFPTALGQSPFDECLSVQHSA